jgi:hypothetical protein
MAATATANVISRFLGKQGFKRSAYSTTRVRGWGRWSEGYEVRTINDQVRVEWNLSSSHRFGNENPTEAKLDAMEKALNERYTVTRDKVGISDRVVLIVTPKEAL